MNREEITKEMDKTIQENHLEKINGSLYLTKYQQQILNHHHITFKECKSAKELLFLLEDNIDEDEEMEEVVRQIDEYSYYHEIRQ